MARAIFARVYAPAMEWAAVDEAVRSTFRLAVLDALAVANGSGQSKRRSAASRRTPGDGLSPS